MKITYYVGKIDSLFRKHEPKVSLKEADTVSFGGCHCFVYVDDALAFSYPHDDKWLDHWSRRTNNRYRKRMNALFERWIRLKLRCLQRTQPSA